MGREPNGEKASLGDLQLLTAKWVARYRVRLIVRDSPPTAWCTDARTSPPGQGKAITPRKRRKWARQGRACYSLNPDTGSATVSLAPYRTATTTTSTTSTTPPTAGVRTPTVGVFPMGSDNTVPSTTTSTTTPIPLTA